jgi:16S rRNA (guanine527-N7)-methyltransferase
MTDMNKEEFCRYYKEIFELNGLVEFCGEEIAEKMYDMTEYMLKVNEYMNLTAITDVREVIAKHLADSVSVSRFIPCGARVCDVGCGGGFPSLPLAIARPDLEILGVDSTDKRINYVNESAKRLELPNLTAVTGRAEDLSRDTRWRESFDVCVARAVANLPVLAELCVPFVKKGGVFIAMKGKFADEESKAARSSCEKLGAEAPNADNVYRFTLKTSDGDDERSIVVLKKTVLTDAKYPRNYSQIKKKPL